jgi:glutathione S-transferase
MKLYDCQSAPSPRRVRIFLSEKGIEIPTVQVDLGLGEHLGNDFKGLNPDCTVPVLELDDGTCISEVTAICQYVEAIHPDPCLLGRDAKESALVTMWNAKIEQHGLLALAETYRNKVAGLRSRALTGPINYEQIPELVARGNNRAEAFMLRLNERLSESKYVAYDEFTIADISAWVMIDFAKWSHIEIRNEWTDLQRWYDRVRVRESANA